MEKVYKIKIDIESTDETDIAEALYQIADEISEGDVTMPVKKHINSGNVESTVEGMIVERCEDCRGAGEISVDERDPDSGQMMSMVGSLKCHCKSE